jgi:hypothetical protein
MFPALQDDWILGTHVWRARYAQPVVVRGYRRLIPSIDTPIAGLFLCSMAQVFPEDRGTNYAIREGRAAARTIAETLHRVAQPRLEAPELGLTSTSIA